MRLLILSVAALLALGGCDRIGETVADAKDDAEELAEITEFCVAAGRLASAINDRDPAAARAAAEDVAQEAPAEIRDEAQIVLDVAKQAEAGEREALQSERFQDAAQAVADYAREHCDPTS